MTPEQETLLRIIIDEAQEEAVYNTLAAALEGHEPAREEYERLKRKANQHAYNWIKAAEDLTGKAFDDIYPIKRP